MKKIIIYTGPNCAFCNFAKALLDSKKISYEEIDIGYDTNKREEMMEKANGMRTIPQIFIGNFHVGGNAELQTLEKEGKLNALVGI